MVELLAPAGNLEKMKMALQYGADAVYFGLPDFSLRARSNQFTKNDIIEAQKHCEKYDKSFYITMNIYAHNIHLAKIEEQIQWLKKRQIKPDGIIVSDPGVIRLLKKYLPEVDLHLSTQANATNLEAVKFWRDLGVKRVVLAREVTLDEIAEIHQAVPEVELEVFVHGAMCMSYSGRCILSKWMTGRGANLGDCAQPCRWKWQSIEAKSAEKEALKTGECKQTELVDDQKRFGMRVEEDRHGTYMFNSYDISLIEHLDKLLKAGVVSLKIEGRAKSVYYLATVVRSYKQVLECLDKEGMKKNRCQKVIEKSAKELVKISNRGYWTGFVLGDEPPHLFDKSYLAVDWEFAGLSEELHKIISVGEQGLMLDEEDDGTKKRIVFVHNQLKPGDEVEVIGLRKNFQRKVKSIKNEDGEIVSSAHGGLGNLFQVEFDRQVPVIFLLRRNLKNNS